MTQKTLKTLFAFLLPLASWAQSESHDFYTKDTTLNFSSGSWIVRISAPKTDTTRRAAIIMAPGQGEMGANALSSTLGRYGPHYWVVNGWDGGVVLGNGKHYPILVTVEYKNNYYPNAIAAYDVLTYLLKTLPINPKAVHLTGLSQGAFTWGALLLLELQPGAESGMKLVSTLTALEGTPDPLPSTYNSWSRGFTAYKVWAKKYNGRYFYLEGSGTDNFRDGWQWATPMNDSVPGSAYFSYETLGGGGHCCWNDMYNPAHNNWTCVGTLGPYNGASQVGKNQMGSYRVGQNLFQWMLANGDSTLAVPGAVPPPVIIPAKTIKSILITYTDGTSETKP